MSFLHLFHEPHAHGKHSDGRSDRSASTDAAPETASPSSDVTNTAKTGSDAATDPGRTDAAASSNERSNGSSSDERGHGAHAHAHAKHDDTKRGRIARAWRNVGLIFLGDMRHLMRNAITAIVTMGLILVPPLYAWFTTLGFWDPYNNTGNLSVAVANEDTGFESDLIPVRVNAGDRIISALRANDQFKWIFIDKDRAIDGVKSSEYYAAIIIPEDFSADLMAAFTSGEVKPARIDYYSNEKENAIAPRVTSTGVSALQQKIDEAFTQTIAGIALDTTSDLTDFMSGEGIENYGVRLLDHLDDILADLDTASREVSLFASLVESTSSLLSSTSAILTDIGTTADQIPPILSDTRSTFEDTREAATGLGQLVSDSLDRGAKSFETISAAVERIFQALKDDPAAAQELLGNIEVNLNDMIDTLSTIRSLVDDSTLVPDEDAERIGNAIGDVISDLRRLQYALLALEASLQSATADMDKAHSEVQAAIDEAKGSFDAMESTYGSRLRSKMDELVSELEDIQRSATELSDGVGSVATDLSGTAGDLSDSLVSVQAALKQTSSVLADVACDLTGTRNRLQTALDSGDLETVRKIIGDNPETIAAFLSSPTKLVEHPVYAVANNGSIMNSFYSSLAIWIGAIFSVALASTNLSKRRIALLDDPHPWQLYLGRYGVFAVISSCQATILCLGNVLFLGVQCQHFLLYMLAGWVAAIVFSNIVYTLTISFGNVGKALAIVLLVMQLAGTGGLMPVQMTAPIFQAIYPWLPFSRSMEAFQSCVAGIYGMQYWISIAVLLMFIIPMLLLGMALRNPTIRLIDFINEKLDETDVI